MLITVVPGVLLNPDSLPGIRAWGGWNLFEHLLFFSFGYFAYSAPSFSNFLECNRFRILAGAIVATVVFLFIFFSDIRIPFGSSYYLLKILLRSTFCWTWILTILGFAKYHLNYTNPNLKYTSEAVLPFYMLHQTVIIILGFFILKWNQPLSIKYLAIAFASFLLIMLCYEFVIRRNSILRYFFGMPSKINKGI
jgi:surface polysaccharide O-acyltransferase-like enzyme